MLLDNGRSLDVAGGQAQSSRAKLGRETKTNKSVLPERWDGRVPERMALYSHGPGGPQHDPTLALNPILEEAGHEHDLAQLRQLGQALYQRTETDPVLAGLDIAQIWIDLDEADVLGEGVCYPHERGDLSTGVDPGKN
jgi:hypothetical protein